MIRRRPIVAAALVLGFVGAAGGASVAFAAENPADPDGFSLTVTVLPSGETASPTPSPSPDTNGGGTGSGGGSGSSGGGGDTPAEPGAEPEPEPDETGIDGLLYVGGVQSQAGWSWDTFGAALETSIVVRNASAETFDTTVQFSMEGPFGVPVAVAEPIAVKDLKPGERRTVSTVLDGAGQWTYLHLVAEVTPPKELAPDAAPLVRDAWTFVLPWFIAVRLVLAATALLVVWLVGRAGTASAAPARPAVAAGAPA